MSKQVTASTTKHPTSQDSCQPTSTLRLAAASYSSPDDSRRVSPCKLPEETKKRKSNKRVQKSSNDEYLSEEPVVQIGAVNIATGVTDDTRNDDGVHGHSVMGSITTDDIESPELPIVGSSEPAIEAHVVEDSFPGLLEEEKEKYEEQTRQRILAEIAGQAALAEIVIDENEIHDGRSLLLRGCCCLMLVLVVAITTGIVVSRKSVSEGSNAIAIVLPLTQEPSGHPSMMPTSEPSLMPTTEPLNNAYCEQPHQLVLGQNVSGSFDDGIISRIVNCQTPFASSVYPAPSRWYWYRGEGFPVALRGDDFVDVRIYRACYDSNCPLGILYPNADNSVNNVALWEAKQGTDYLILVTKARGMKDEGINMTFTVTIEANDSLENAFGPLNPGPNTILGGSTVGTKVPSDFPACGAASAPTGPGVWYSVIGNGKTITASTCGSPTGLDTQISIFSSENVCVDGNDEFCTGKSQVAWLSNADEIYYVLVHGKDGAEGTFILQVTEGVAFADADLCSNSLSVDIGSTELDLSQATIDTDVQNCIGSPVYGNFYAFNGTGTPVLTILNTIAPLEDLPFYVQIGAEILTGSSCSGLECLGSCPLDCHFSTVLGQTYYIYVFYYAPELINTTERNMLNGFVSLTLEIGDNYTDSFC